MNEPSRKLQHRAQEQTAEETQASTHQHQVTQAQEFASAEELIRHDASHTPVPPAVADRLRNSLRNEPPPPRTWWQRLFSR